MEKNKHSWCEMLNLPDEIIIDILSRLPVKSLLRFRCVCKAWRTLVTNPRFVNLHLNQANENNDDHLNLIIIRSGRYLFNVNCLFIDCIDAYRDPAIKLDPPFESSIFYMRIVGSCNGLLCVFIPRKTVFLWNPSTGEYKKIICSPIYGGFDNDSILGFGYSPTTEQYKVVRIIYSYPDVWNVKNFQSQVEVYTLGMDSWKEIGDVPYKIHDQSLGKYVNGAFHWMASSSGVNRSLEVIVSFDIGDEKFREVPLPDFGKRDPYMNLGVLEGCLCIISNFGDNHVDIWVMKDYGVRESWTKQFIIRQPPKRGLGYLRRLNPIGSSKSGEILLLEGNNEELVLYNSKTDSIRDPRICGISPFKTVAYVGSLVSLKG